MAIVVEYVPSERARAANIEQNRALLQKLQLDEGPTKLGFVAVNSAKKAKGARTKDGSKPVQPRKSAGKKRKASEIKESDGDEEEVIVRRISTRRRRGPVDPNETPEQKALREVSLSSFNEILRTDRCIEIRGGACSPGRAGSTRRHRAGEEDETTKAPRSRTPERA